MEVFLVLFVILTIAIWFFFSEKLRTVKFEMELKINDLRDRIKFLERTIHDLIEKETKIKARGETTKETVPAAEKPKPLEAAPAPAAQPKIEIAGSYNPPKELEGYISPYGRKKREAKLSAKPGIWDKLEKQIVENWTGIIGSIIMVVGIGFLGVYAALNMEPFYRFCLIMAFSLVLIGLFAVLRPREKWLKLALWLRSSAGATILFACVGAGSIDGLKWIDNSFYALIMVVAGIIINLYFAYAGGNQVFASLHVLLSLVALAIPVQTNTLFIVGTIVTLFGIAFTYREKWNYHLLLTISAYFIYHLWWNSVNIDAVYIDTVRVIGIVCVALVGVSALLVHYLQAYHNNNFDLLPFTVHLFNWVFFGIGLLMHSAGSKAKTFILAAGAIAAFFLARKTKNHQARWLYLTDNIIALIVAYLVIFSLRIWNVGAMHMLSLYFIVTLLYSLIMYFENEELLYKTGLYLSNVSIAIYFFYTGVRTFLDTGLPKTEFTISLLIVFFAGTFFHIFAVRKIKDKFFVADFLEKGFTLFFNAICTGFLLYFVFYLWRDCKWPEYLMFMLVPYLIIRQKYQSLSFDFTAILLIILFNLTAWGQSFINYYISIDLLARTLHILPQIILPVFIMYLSYSEHYKRHFRFIGLYLFFINLWIAVYFLFSPQSIFIPGVLYLALSIIFLMASMFINKRDNSLLKINFNPERAFFEGAVISLILMFIFYFSYYFYSSQMLFTIHTRHIVSGFGIAGLLYFAMCKPGESDKSYALRNYLLPLFLEALFAFCIILIFHEADMYWYTIILIAFAFLCLLAGKILPVYYSRLRLYALLGLFITSFEIALLSFNSYTDGTPWNLHVRFTGAISFAALIIFVIIYYRMHPLKDVKLPFENVPFNKMIQSLDNNIIKWLLYPLFICGAVYIFNTFDKSVLTLMWAGEAFVIFTLSIFFLDKSFRYTSLIIIFMSVIRLVFYDLSKADTLMRAIVFLGVGILMLIMNSVFNKYKDRYSKE